MTFRWVSAWIAGMLTFFSLAAWQTHDYQRDVSHLRQETLEQVQMLTRLAAAIVGQTDAERDDLSLNNRLEELVRLPGVLSLAVLNSDGHIRWHSDPHQEGSTGEIRRIFSTPQYDPIEECAQFSAKIPSTQRPGSHVALALSALPDLASLRRRFFWDLSVAGVIAGLVMGIVWLLWKYPSREFHRLADALSRTAEGLPLQPHGLRHLREFNEIHRALSQCLALLGPRPIEALSSQGTTFTGISDHVDTLSNLMPDTAWMLLDSHNHVLHATSKVGEILNWRDPGGRHILELHPDQPLLDLIRQSNVEKKKVHERSWGNFRASAWSIPSDPNREGTTLILIRPQSP